MLEIGRPHAIGRREQRRRSRLITMIHRQETMSFRSFPIARGRATASTMVRFPRVSCFQTHDRCLLAIS